MGRVLLVEPDVVLARNYTVALEAAGHEVMSTASAQLAVNLADKVLPDVLVVELQLPAHNGVEFLYEFRSYPEWQDIPAIVLTGLSPRNPGMDTTAWGELGVVKHLYKPSTKLRDLVANVNSVLSEESV